MVDNEFYTRKPPLNFTLNVIATDLPMEDPDFKIKVQLDFVPEFTPTRQREISNFNGNRINEILNFVANKVITKVIEFIYYDRSNLDGVKNGSCEESDLADNFHDALAIYNERLKIKAKREDEDDLSYSKYREERGDQKDEGFYIQEIVNNFFHKSGRKITLKEENVTRITYTVLSEPTLSCETKTPINGDKNLPR